MKSESGGILNKLGSNKLVAKLVAKGIKKEEFLAELEEAWYPVIKTNANPEVETDKAMERITKAGYLGVFKSAKITREDILELVKKIQASKPKPIHVEAKPGRNEPCPCGSGKKYKNCCGG